MSAGRSSCDRLSCVALTAGPAATSRFGLADRAAAAGSGADALEETRQIVPYLVVAGLEALRFAQAGERLVVAPLDGEREAQAVMGGRVIPS